jgi:membrane-associated phospholipid phosphatase
MNFGGIDKEIYSEFSKFFYAVGFFSELIMIILVCALLFNQHFDLIFYVIGININGLINRTLKPLLKGRRPNDPVKFLDSEKFVRNSNAYGMPSGHSQSVFFSIVYLYLCTKQYVPWVILGLCIGALMFYERWVFHNHTVAQLVVGAALGCGVAYITVYAKDYIKDYVNYMRTNKIPITFPPLK